MASTKGSNANPAVGPLDSISQQLFDIWAPMQKAGAAAGADILKTGGSDSTTPIIQQLIQSMRSGLSKTMVDTQGRLGMARQAGTPFGQRILAETQREGQSSIASAGPEMMMKMLSLLMPAATGGSGQAVSGLGASAEANARTLASQNAAYADIMSSMIPKTSVIL